jgi:uncharacterized protein (UPF0335 family)
MKTIHIKVRGMGFMAQALAKVVQSKKFEDEIKLRSTAIIAGMFNAPIQKQEDLDKELERRGADRMPI